MQCTHDRFAMQTELCGTKISSAILNFHFFFLWNKIKLAKRRTQSKTCRDSTTKSDLQQVSISTYSASRQVSTEGHSTRTVHEQTILLLFHDKRFYNGSIYLHQNEPNLAAINREGRVSILHNAAVFKFHIYRTLPHAEVKTFRLNFESRRLKFQEFISNEK